MRRRPLLLLLALLALQLASVSGRFGQPFLDGRKHTHYDNAAFLLRAVHSLAPDLHHPLDVFGLTEYAYDEDNVPVAAGYYNHHGVALPVMLRAAVASLGPREAAINAVMIALSLASTILMFSIVRRATRSDWPAFGIVLLYILLPLKFIYADKVKYEVVVELFLLLCVDLLGRIPAGRRARPLFLVAFFLAFQTDFYAFIPAGLLWVAIACRRAQPGMERLPLHACLAGGLGVAVTLTVQYLLGFHPGAAIGIAGFRMSLAGSSVTTADYAARQYAFLTANLGEAALALAMMALLVLLLRRRAGWQAAGVAGMVFLGGAVAWVLLMRNHSYIHHYAQWLFVTACPLLLAGAVSALRDPESAAQVRAPASGGPPLLLAALLPVLLLTALDTRRLAEQFRNGDLGRQEDIALLRSLDKRIVVLSEGRSGPMEWWFSPVPRLYTDPVFRNSTRVGVVRADQVQSLDPANDLIVAINSPDVWIGMREWCATEHGIGDMEPVQASPLFAYFRFTLTPPSASEADSPAIHDDPIE